MATVVVHPAAAPLETQQKAALLVQAREAANKAYNAAYRAGAKAAHWAHLDALWTWIKGAGSWAMAKANSLMTWLGTSGVLGTLAALVASKTGRTILNRTVGAVVRTAGRVARTVYGWLTKGLRKLGSPGNWIADRMDSGVTWVAKQASDAYTWTKKHLGGFLDTERVPMRALRFTGISMVIFRILTHLAMPAPVAWLGWAAYGVWALLDITMTWEKYALRNGLAEWSEIKDGDGNTVTDKDGVPLLKVVYAKNGESPKEVKERSLSVYETHERIRAEVLKAAREADKITVPTEEANVAETVAMVTATTESERPQPTVAEAELTAEMEAKTTPSSRAEKRAEARGHAAQTAAHGGRPVRNVGKKATVPAPAK